MRCMNDPPPAKRRQIARTSSLQALNSDRTIRIGLIAPMTGPIGLFGPSSLNCALLAVQELNDRGGILGRPIELALGEGGGSTDEIVAEATRLIEEDQVSAIVGSHISTNRLALVQAIGGRIPYVYTTLYEGGEYTYGVFISGETPEQQLRPLLQWLRQRKDARRWYLIGNDYIFPRSSIACAKRYLAEADAQIVGEEYLPFFTGNFDASIDRIVATGADAVLVYLVGQDGIQFNREYAQRGLSDSILRAAPVLCENLLLGTGACNSQNLYSSTAFSSCMDTPDAEEFRTSYRKAFGDYAPVLNRFGVSCYSGIHVVAQLAETAGELNLHKMQAASEGTTIRGPAGESHMSGNHLSATIHIVESNGIDMRVLDTVGKLPPPRPAAPIWPARDAGEA